MEEVTEVARSVDVCAAVRQTQGWRWPAVLARHSKRRDDNVQQHDNVDEVRNDVLPRGDAHEQRGVSVSVSQLGQLRITSVAHLRQLPVRFGVVAHAQRGDELATCLLQLLGGRHRRSAVADVAAAALRGAL